MGKIASPYWAEPIKKLLRNQAVARERLATVKFRQPLVHLSTEGTIDTNDRNPQVGPNNLRVVNGNSAFTGTTDSSTPPAPPSPETPRPFKSGASKLADYNPRKSYFGPVNEVSEKSDAIEVSTETSSDGTIQRRNSIVFIDIPDEISVDETDNGHTVPTSASQLSNALSVNSSRAWLNTNAGLKLLDGFGIPDNNDGRNFHPSPIPEDAAVLSQVEASGIPLRTTIVEPSIATLDRAASAKIYFENLYFPILRQPPSREQRRLALERDLAQMRHLTEIQKEEIRQRWRLNETEYLREKRQRVSAEAFKRLKVIGHGAFGIVSLVREQSTGNLYAMKQVQVLDLDHEPNFLTTCF